MNRLTAQIDASDVYSYAGWPLANIIYSFLIDDYNEYEKNPEWRRMQMKKAILLSAEFQVVQNGGRLINGHAVPFNPYGTNLGANR